MIKLTFLVDNSDYSNYKDRAMERFNEFVQQIGLKDKTYKNGIRKVWFTKTDWKYGKYLVDNMAFESIPMEIKR